MSCATFICKDVLSNKMVQLRLLSSCLVVAVGCLLLSDGELRNKNGRSQRD